MLATALNHILHRNCIATGESERGSEEAKTDIKKGEKELVK